MAYFSQGLSEKAQQKPAYERELMAISLAVQKWRHYLMGYHFIINIDKKSLKFLTEQRLMGEVQFKWTSKLLCFDFKIKYKPRADNKVADSLSRKMIFEALSLVQMEDLHGLLVEI